MLRIDKIEIVVLTLNYTCYFYLNSMDLPNTVSITDVSDYRG